MVNFLYTQVTYVSLVISVLVGLGVGLTASALKYSPSISTRKQQVIKPLSAGIVLLSLGVLSFFLVILLESSISGTLFSRWIFGYVLGVMIGSLIFSGLSYFYARRTMRRLR